AFERILTDEVEAEGERLVFTGEDVLAKAKQFHSTNSRPAWSPYDLAEDVKATPLLREVGADAYAFSHLTLQEYLAATALARRPDRERVFCRAYFDPTLVEMEVLPMAVGVSPDPDALYELAARLPESLSLAGLRLRARCLAYAPNVGRAPLEAFTARVRGLVVAGREQDAAYADSVCRSIPPSGGAAVNHVVDEMSALLRDESAAARAGAARALGQIGSERATDALVRVLRGDADADVRWQAAYALRRIADRRAVGALIEALSDLDGIVVAQAAYALGEVGDARAAPALLDLLRKGDLISESAARAIGQIGDERLAPELVELVRRGGEHVRDAAAHALAYMGKGAAVRGLVEVIRRGNNDARWAAAYALESIDDPRAAEALAEAARDADSFVRERVMKGLGRIGNARAVEALQEALGDESEDVRREAAAQLGLGDEGAREILKGAADAPSYDVRETAAALAIEERASEPEELLAALRDPRWEMRWRAAAALGRVGTEREVPALVEAARDEDSFVRVAAISALGSIGGELAVTALVELTRAGDANTYREAISALGDAGGEQALPLLADALRREDGMVRHYAVIGIAGMSGEEAFAALSQAVLDTHGSVREEAARALSRSGDARAVEPMLRALDEEIFVDLLNSKTDLRVSVVVALGRMAPEALAAGLMRSLESEHASVRRRAAELVGYYVGDERALEALTRLAESDPAAEVRSAADAALAGVRLRLARSV
ncbi:MAG TPA: HEAT repeat domain-containing protein, partial [Pyrinomonadaceae bacterium]|nr:HEAT repeat domain-containing protein [Pyrinomonadaceae bacterium]